MKVMQSGRQTVRRLIIFSAYVYFSDFILGVLVRRAIYFWAFWPNFLAYKNLSWNKKISLFGHIKYWF